MCFDFNNVSSREGEGELGYLVFLEVTKWNYCNLAQGMENWEYISQTNFDHYWSSLLEVVGAKERKLYWDQEEDLKQEGEDDCCVNVLLLIEKIKIKANPL